MKFLCLAYEEESVLNALSRAEWDALRRETLDYVETLRRNGQLVLTEPLRSARTAVTVRVRNERVTTTDGPYAETKEHIGGFFLIDVRDSDEAIRIAARWPSARLGTIEVRPLEIGLPEDARYPSKGTT